MPLALRPTHPDSHGPQSSFIDWDQVVVFEPETVAERLKSLHSRKDRAIRGLLVSLGRVLQQLEAVAQVHPAQWGAFVRTRLPNALMDIACDPDMFSTDPNAFSDLSYTSDILFVLHVCLKCVVIPPHNPSTFRDTVGCAKDLLSKQDGFYRCLWEHRHTVKDYYLHQEQVRATGSWSAQFPQSAVSCISWLLHILKSQSTTNPSSTNYATQFLLFYWAYGTDQDSLKATTDLHTLLTGNITNLTAFTRDFVGACPPDYPERFLLKACDIMRQIAVKTPASYETIRIVSSVLVNNPGPFVNAAENENQLVSNLILFCHRQLCASPDISSLANYTTAIVLAIFDCLQALIEKSGHQRPNRVEQQFIQCAGGLNVISIIAYTMIGAIREPTTASADRVLLLLGCVEQPLQRFIKYGLDPSLAPEYPALHRTTYRIWHDTLRSMEGVRAHSEHQDAYKKAMIGSWRMFGSFFGIEEGVNVTTASGPSTPSDERLYWDIPQHCFWGSCGCSAVETKPHEFRVCKGCWRVLYCNRHCQRADWEAGHRLVCQPLTHT